MGERLFPSREVTGSLRVRSRSSRGSIYSVRGVDELVAWSECFGPRGGVVHPGGRSTSCREGIGLSDGVK